MKQNKSVERLEINKDYINIHDNNLIVIDRVASLTNRGFEGGNYTNSLSCSNHSNWREATEEEVIEAFKKHLVYRYGEDWETMKIKEKHPALPSSLDINDGVWAVEISNHFNSWRAWNKNGLLYFNGFWVERLEEPANSTDWTPAPEDIEVMNEKEIEKLPINKVTTTNLDIALRIAGIQLDVNIINKIIDLVELIGNKGDDVTIKDIVSLQQTR